MGFCGSEKVSTSILIDSHAELAGALDALSDIDVCIRKCLNRCRCMSLPKWPMRYMVYAGPEGICNYVDPLGDSQVLERGPDLAATAAAVRVAFSHVQVGLRVGGVEFRASEG